MFPDIQPKVKPLLYLGPLLLVMPLKAVVNNRYHFNLKPENVHLIMALHSGSKRGQGRTTENKHRKGEQECEDEGKVACYAFTPLQCSLQLKDSVLQRDVYTHGKPEHKQGMESQEACACG